METQINLLLHNPHLSYAKDSNDYKKLVHQDVWIACNYIMWGFLPPNKCIPSLLILAIVN